MGLEDGESVAGEMSLPGPVSRTSLLVIICFEFLKKGCTWEPGIYLNKMKDEVAEAIW